MLLESALLGLAMLATAVACYAAAVARTAAAPRLVEALREIGERVAAAESKVDTTRAAWQTYKAEMEALLEAIEDQVSTLEHKRRKIASHVSRAEAATGQAAPDNVTELRRRARAAGLPV